MFRLRDKGLPSVQSYGKGDQLINVNIWTPKELTSEEKKMMEKLRNHANFQPTPDKGDRTFFDRMRDYFQ